MTTVTVRKRSGTTADFNRDKIKAAVSRCLVNSCGRKADDRETKALIETVAERVEGMIKKLSKGHKAAAPLVFDVEAIQDLVENALMACGEHQAAREYILFREERRKQRQVAEVDPEVAKMIREDVQKNFRTPLSVFQHYDKYSRFDPVLKRRETFNESVTKRIIPWLRQRVTQEAGSDALPPTVWKALEEALLNEEAAPSMRLLQVAGPAASRCEVGIYNCSFAGISDPDYFAESLYISMQGTGQAFSVEREHIEKLPQIRAQRKASPDTIEIPDTTEGWCDSVKTMLYRLYDGHDVQFDYRAIRPAGAPLRTKGGTASGPEPLRQLHDFIRRTALSNQNRRLSDIAVHDIMCYIGQAGQLGGFRRAAMLSLSDLDSHEMRMAKFGKFWADPACRQRSMANNTAAYNVKPSVETFMSEWMSLATSKSGERGILNRASLNTHQLPKRRVELYNGENIAWGLNPCAEIFLHPGGQMCNLSIAIVRPDDTYETLAEKVKLAAIFGTIQSMLTKFNYLRPRWAENCRRERLLGVDLLGALDAPILRNAGREEVLRNLKDVAVETNRYYAGLLGIEASTAVTCIKPGGNSSVRWGTGQSMSGWLSEYNIRNVEVGNHQPMCQFLRDAGVPCEPSYRDPNTTIFSFPYPAPPDAFIVADLVTDAAGNVVQVKQRGSAIDQLESWLVFKRNWTEHNPSCSIYVADDEWFAVGDWVWKHWDHIGGLSFFPLDGGVYPQAPITPMTKANYEAFAAKFPTIPWEKLPRYDGGVDRTSVLREAACSAGACTI